MKRRNFLRSIASGIAALLASIPVVANSKLFKRIFPWRPQVSIGVTIYKLDDRIRAELHRVDNDTMMVIESPSFSGGNRNEWRKSVDDMMANLVFAIQEQAFPEDVPHRVSIFTTHAVDIDRTLAEMEMRDGRLVMTKAAEIRSIQEFSGQNENPDIRKSFHT